MPVMQQQQRPLLFRRSWVLCVCLLLLIFSPISASAADNSRYGIWVEAQGTEQPFDNPKSLQKLIHHMSEIPYTDVYCQVYRNGLSWFPSALADDMPYRQMRAQGADALSSVINHAHRKGAKTRVHAWINALRIKRNKTAPIFQTIGKSAAHKDNWGNSLLSYENKFEYPPGEIGKKYQLDTSGIWLDPANPKVRAYLVEVIRDVIVAYPQLDGIHLDMIRFPFPVAKNGHKTSKRELQLGYNPESLALFREEQKIPMKAELPSLARNSDEVWDSWRRQQITKLIIEIRQMMNEIAPHMEFSIAGIGDPDRARNWALQDWETWIKQGYLDSVVPMIYTSDRKEAERLVKHATSVAPKGRILAGLGAWLMLDRQWLMTGQIKDALHQDTAGVVLFSYSNIYNKIGKQLVRNAADTIRRNDTQPIITARPAPDKVRPRVRKALTIQ